MKLDGALSGSILMICSQSKEVSMIDRDENGNILYYPKPYDTVLADCRIDLSTPKEYGQKLLNRKRGRK